MGGGGEMMKNTTRNTQKKSFEHTSLLLENSHAMHFRTMPMCIIQSQKIELTLARLCKKYMIAVSQTKRFKLHSLQIFSN